MATDAEMRDQLLKVFYDLRHSNGGWVPASDMNLAGMAPVDLQVVDNICRHLAEDTLIEWKPLRGSDGLAAGMARITGRGVRAVEGKASQSINLTLPKQEPPTGVAAKGVAGGFAQPSSSGGVAAKGEAGNLVPDTQSWEAAAQIAVRQRGMSAAVRSTTQTVEPLAAPQMSFPNRGATIHVPHTTVVVAVLQNRIQIGNTAASLSLLIDEKITSLQAELPNSTEAQTVRDQSIAVYEDLKSKLEAFQNAVLALSADKAKEEAVVAASASFADGVAAWWTKCHVQICEKAYDMWLFGLGVGICSLAGSDGQLAVVVSGALVGGKPVAGAIKALLQKK